MNQNPTLVRLMYFGIPAIAFVGVRMFAGGPQSSHAADSIEAPMLEPLPVTVEHNISDEARTGEQIAAGMRENLSPFWYDEVAGYTPAQIQETVEYKPQEQGMPSFEVSAILPHPKRPLAVINGKPCQISDHIASGWVLTGIDGETRTVTLKDSAGKTHVISISRQ